MIKAMLLHLGSNMWNEWLPEEVNRDEFLQAKRIPARKLQLDEGDWRKATDRRVRQGIDTLLIDLGDAMVFPSHPELAIEGSWSPDRMKAEIARLKAQGVTAYPKLNFSTTHDGWLKDYHRMVSTPAYYKVVKDVIRDTAEVFGTPELFHIGFDEERAEWSGGLNYYVARQGDLWWHDYLYTIKCVEDCGCRAWVWSDVGPHKPDYCERCPKSVMQTAWYYDAYNAKLSMDKTKNPHWWKLQNFIDLEKAGFDQIPCGTNWIGHVRRRLGVNGDDVMGLVTRFCRANVSPDRLKGFLMAPWAMSDGKPENLEKNLKGIDLFKDALADAGF